MSHVHLHGGPAPVRRFLPDLMDRIWQRKINPARCSTSSSARRRGVRLPRHGHPPGHQGPAAPVNPTYDFTGQVALVTGAGSGMDWPPPEPSPRPTPRSCWPTSTPRPCGPPPMSRPAPDTRRSGSSATYPTRTASPRRWQRRPDVRQVGHGVQQRRHPDPAVRRRRRTRRSVRPRQRDQPARRVGVHETRTGQMRSQGSGAIVNCSSLGGLVGIPGRAAYHASKHGVLGLAVRRSSTRRGESGSTPFARAPSPPRWSPT